jgi:hypothetical protein
MPVTRTNVTEGFYRQQGFGNQHSDNNRNSNSSRSISAVSALNMDDRSTAPARGSLMPPGELGVDASESSLQASSNESPRASAHPATLRARQRTRNAILKSQQRANKNDHDDDYGENLVEPGQGGTTTKLASFTYKGMEVTFATTNYPSCYAMCSRTRFVFQTLDLPSDQPVIALVANASTGQIVVAHADGLIRTYLPQRTDPTQVAFGRYHWYNGPAIDACAIFYQQKSLVPLIFNDAVSAAPGETLDLSASADYRVLVAHQTQLAVFDCSATYSGVATTNAELLWTTRLPGKVATAKLSGDGQVIALALTETEPGNKAGGGAHTFQRDHLDGSDLDVSSNNSRSGSTRAKRLELVRSQSVGIVYKPGPFLVHACPVTRLAFRGQGHNNSNSNSSSAEQGSDLLLTYCAGDHSARIFCQNDWRTLTQWTTLPLTRVDWVKGVSAFTLGDLENTKKPRASVSAPPSRRPSMNANTDSEAAAINETLGKRHHYQSIPNHSSPASNAGAWVSELTFHKHTPAIRLSRLTYLKRGVDDLNPTLFDNVSAFLPISKNFQEILLKSDEGGFSVEGIWPAWNPWLSDGVESTSNDTLRGSAMAFLGLSGGPGVSTAGNMGDGLLGRTQSPPCEVRILATHPSPSKLLILEYPLLGDQDWTSLELGNPRKAVLALSNLDIMRGSKGDAAFRERTRHVSAIDFESSRLIANFHDDSSSISIVWRKPGPLALLPSNWLPQDVEPQRMKKVFSERKWFKDESVMPAPLALPGVRIPSDLSGDSISSILWWPDASFGGPPLLVAILASGTVVVFELPPPWSSQEPVALGRDVPFFDVLSDTQNGGASSEGMTGDIYEVLVTPDVQFGLGIRLEVKEDGTPAIVGSFKRSPVDGAVLPSELTGQVTLGDELVSANDVNLEDKLFDEIIASVRDIGASCGPGYPMRLKFRRMADRKAPELSLHRTVEQILGINKSKTTKKGEDEAKPQTFGADEQAVASDSQSVVAVFKEALKICRVDDECEPKFSLVSCAKSEVSASMGIERSACLFYSNGCKLSTVLMELHSTHRREKARLHDLGDCNNAPNDAFQITQMDVIALDENNFCLFVCNLNGEVRLVFATKNAHARPALTSRTFDVFKMPGGTDPRRLVLRVSAVDLLATMQPTMDGSSNVILVWSAVLHPGTDSMNSETSSIYRDYQSSPIHSENEILDFAFIDTGYLEGSASIVAFSRDNVTMFCRQGGDPRWLPTVQITYKAVPGSVALAFRGEDLSKNAFLGGESPHNSFSHLVPGLLTVYSSVEDAQQLCSDWHPESLLAQIFMDSDGALDSLQRKARRVFVWLCLEAGDIPADHFISPLVVAPFPITEDIVCTEGGSCAFQTGQQQLRRDSIGVEAETKCLRSLHIVLSDYCKLGNTVRPNAQTEESYDSSTAFEVPPVLQQLSLEDLHILRAFCELIIDTPDGTGLDNASHDFVFGSALLRKLQSANLQTLTATVRPDDAFPVPGVLVRSQSRAKVACNQSAQIPPTSCMFALLSNTQFRLVEYCKGSGRKLNWQSARELRLPFWVRSDAVLSRLSEEIGQNTYRDTRDIMECALFFVIAGKTTTLRNLAATDHSENGQKFLKFLTSHDFSSERGRRASEKNAFSLLRKCKYRMASAIFLLAQPPYLTAAIETIATKLKDLDLAFLVSRLMESTDAGAQSLGVGFGLGSLGGGSGYAAPSVMMATSNAVDDIKAEKWKPNLKRLSRKLLVERALPSSANDCAFSAVQLMWLDKREEASWVLMDTINPACNVIGFSVTSGDSSRLFDGAKSGFVKSSIVVNAIEKASTLIDFLSSPKLLNLMQASARPQFASALTVAQALSAKGMEVPSIQCIIRYANMCKLTDDATLAQSHILDSYDSRISATNPATEHMQSSIFKSFDTYSPAGRPAQTLESTEASGMESSTFDSFDTPRLDVVKPAVAAQAQCIDEIQSSIFDTFDGPRPLKPLQVGLTAEKMDSSIFDAFDSPRPQLEPARTCNAKQALMSSLTENTLPNGSDLLKGKASETECDIPQITLSMKRVATPLLWMELKNSILDRAAARRLLREIASVLAQFNGDPTQPDIANFYCSESSLIPSSASGILQVTCDADYILGRVLQSLNELSVVSGISQDSIVHTALKLLGPSHQQHRTLISVVLLAAMGLGDLAEDVIRVAAADLMQLCHAFAFSQDDIFIKRKSKFHVATQFLRRRAARVSWQLETCLWLHRGGGLPLSGVALKEGILSVRVGLLLASWNNNHSCIEAMIRSDPDCHTDDEGGRQLWTSLRNSRLLIAKQVDSKKSSSGGWEFLVDCRRSEATSMLSDKKTGCFIIRPHSGDHGVFTLSFKTNLLPSNEDSIRGGEDMLPGSANELPDRELDRHAKKTKKKKVKEDDVVQHAIVRLTESGYRCGSFGPFTSLISLLEAVSESLPFKLRFDLPPSNRIIQEEGTQPSPNAVFLRKLALSHADSLASNPPNMAESPANRETLGNFFKPHERLNAISSDETPWEDQKRSFGMFLELLVLSAVRKQLSSVAAAKVDDLPSTDDSEGEEIEMLSEDDTFDDDSSRRVIYNYDMQDDSFSVAFRILNPLLSWCRTLEVLAVEELAPPLKSSSEGLLYPGVEASFSKTSMNSTDVFGSGDTLLRTMIQRDSGVTFSTLKLVDGGDSTIVVIFSQQETANWLVTSEKFEKERDAIEKLKQMERDRVIESIDLNLLPLKQKVEGLEQGGIRYRILDPWEVESLQNWEGETLGASLGREQFVGFNLGKVGLACETVFRSLGGLPLLTLWTSTKGGVVLTKALASLHPPWERAGGGDLQFKKGVVAEPAPFENSMRQHLYRNFLFRRLGMPQRFLALMQVELLDLKNLTVPGGSLSMSVYALLRLKREGSTALLTNKARTLDTAATSSVKLGKSSGPNAPASWGSVVRFRFPLPEDVSVDGISFDLDREQLFKGPPRVLQVSVYEKKLLVDHSLGSADIRIDGLWAGGQLEEWVPLRSEKHGITWFARIRLTLRFELMCLASPDDCKDLATAAPSVGLRKIREISKRGGASHEDVRRSISSPDLMTYFESMVY